MRKYWTLIKDTEHKRVYRLPFKIRYFKRPGDKKVHTISEIFNDDIELELPKTFQIIDDTDAIDKVCISDATNHKERLVFPVIYVIDRLTGNLHLFIHYIDIDGYMTNPNEGGDGSTIYDDEVYLRHLRMLNRQNKER